MKISSEKSLSYLGVLRRFARILATMFVGVFITLLIGGVYYLNSRPDLSVWHTAELDEEYTAESPVTRFEDYLTLEDRLFVQLDDLLIDGLVHVTALKRDYYQFDAAHHRLVGELSGRQYRLGDRLRVEVVRVNMEERKIDFDLVSVIGESADIRPTRKSRKGKAKRKAARRGKAR